MGLTELAASIPDPVDYFHGVDATMPVLPRNVLLFHRVAPLTGFKPAFHHRHVLINCLEGQGMVMVDGLVHLLVPGQSLLVFPFQCHHYGRFEPGRMSWLFVTFDFEHSDDLAAMRNVTCALDERSRELLTGAAESFLAARAGESAGGDVLGFRVGELLARLVRCAEALPEARPDRPSPPRHEFMRRVVAYLHEHIGKRVVIADVARHACLSPSRLRAVFRQEAGVSLGEFIARNRIDRACALLGTSELNISEVAAACGFDSIYSFSRAFRRQRGHPPSRYRKSLREKLPVGKS